MRKFILLTLFLPFFLNSSPWLSPEDMVLRLKLESLASCNLNIPNISKFPYNLSNIHNEIEELDTSKAKIRCQNLIFEIDSLIKQKIKNTSLSFGFQTGGSKKGFQDFGFSKFSEDAVFVNLNTISENWALKIRGTKLDGAKDSSFLFDESYLSYTKNNKIITLGRISRWWSPSWDNSLILSNNARPSPGISISNNLATEINHPFLSKLGPISYEIFLNKLEKDRHIPNAKFLGAYIAFKPHPRFEFSLFRTGQIGGEGRPETLKTLTNFIIGRDNKGTDGITRENEPGNQLAGGDFSLKILKDFNLEIFGQIVGEDQSNLVPTRTIYNLGISYSMNYLNRANKILIEHTDTDINTTYGGERGRNIAYNHYIYEDGYRYYKKPIGASIDADSSKSTLTYFQELSDLSLFKFKVYKSLINENRSQKNYWGNSTKKIKGYEIALSTKIGERTNIFLEYLELKEKGLIEINENNLMLRLEFEIF